MAREAVGEAAPSRAGAQARPARRSKSERAGLVFPVCKTFGHMKRLHVCPRLGAGAPVYLAAVLEYLAAEVLEVAGRAAKDAKKARITPRHIQLAVDDDEDLSLLLKGVTIAGGGVTPHIHRALLPKSQQARKESIASGGAKE